MRRLSGSRGGGVLGIPHHNHRRHHSRIACLWLFRLMLAQAFALPDSLSTLRLRVELVDIHCLCRRWGLRRQLCLRYTTFMVAELD